jgi:hypothetical protein
MAKSILYRLFGVGKVPGKLRATLESEGLIMFEEGLRGSITYRRYRAPGKWFWWRKNGFSGSLAITGKRVVGFAFSQPVINAVFDDPRYEKLHFTVEDDNCLCASFEASDFHDDRSGSVALRFRTQQARLFEERLRFGGS